MLVVESSMAGGRKEVALAAIAVITTVMQAHGTTKAVSRRQVSALLVAQLYLVPAILSCTAYVCQGLLACPIIDVVAFVHGICDASSAPLCIAMCDFSIAFLHSHMSFQPLLCFTVASIPQAHLDVPQFPRFCTATCMFLGTTWKLP